MPHNYCTFLLFLTGSKLWADDNRVLLLICEYGLRKHKFESTKSCIKHDLLFAEISCAFSEFGIQITRIQCKNKMTSVINIFRRLYDRSRATGQPPEKWPFFAKMSELMKDCANLEPPYAVSVGRKELTFTAKGVVQLDIPRSTRTRPVPVQAQAPSQGKEKVKKPSHQSWLRDLQERNYEKKAELVEEFRLMREDLNARSAERMVVMESIAESIKLSCARKENSKEGYEDHPPSHSTTDSALFLA